MSSSSGKEHSARRARFNRRPIKTGLVTLSILVILIWLPTIYAKLATRHHRYDLNKAQINSIPHSQVALVLGAGVNKDGSPTPYLRWRVDTALKLYKAHRVDKLLMSADNSSSHYNEPQAMRRLAVSEGVTGNDIVLDYAGYSTYDSCYRARAIFKVKSATIITQGYHLPRSIFTCSNLDIPSIGVRALHDGRDFTVNYIAREWLSTDKAMIQLLLKPRPTVLGVPLPIR